MELKRVVVTGIGAVSPNGIGREQFWDFGKRRLGGSAARVRLRSSTHRNSLAGWPLR
jgi:hypothetical protein